MAEIELACGMCDYYWYVMVPDDSESLYRALAAKTGYTCEDCSGIKSEMFPARPVYEE